MTEKNNKCGFYNYFITVKKASFQYHRRQTKQVYNNNISRNNKAKMLNNINMSILENIKHFL